jgi:hypothetical protein
MDAGGRATQGAVAEGRGEGKIAVNPHHPGNRSLRCPASRIPALAPCSRREKEPDICCGAHYLPFSSVA